MDREYGIKLRTIARAIANLQSPPFTDIDFKFRIRYSDEFKESVNRILQSALSSVLSYVDPVDGSIRNEYSRLEYDALSTFLLVFT